MIAIIDGCGRNIASIQFALDRLGFKSILTTDPKIIQSASHVILPGVGSAQSAMDKLTRSHMAALIPKLTQPVLGICLGMQLLFESSDEGNTKALGCLPGKITLLPKTPGLTLPHMGWNQLDLRDITHPLLRNIPDHSYVYFVHSYTMLNTELALATTTHGATFTAIVAHHNFYGMQFHPERSGQIGERLLSNFMALTPT